MLVCDWFARAAVGAAWLCDLRLGENPSTPPCG